MANYNSAYTGAQIDVAVGSVINKTITAADVGASNPNLLINGDFQVWQRGPVVTKTGTFYGSDRWRIESGGSGTTVERVYDTTLHCYAMRVTTSDYANIWQSLEELDYMKYRNRDVTLSFYIKANTAYIPTTTSLSIVTNEWQKISMPSNFGESTAVGLYIFIAAVTQSYTFEVALAKLELGSVATPFVPRPFAEELATCQRYYQKHTTNTVADMDLRPLMRISPTKTGITGGYSYDAEIY